MSRRVFVKSKVCRLLAVFLLIALLVLLLVLALVLILIALVLIVFTVLHKGTSFRFTGTAHILDKWALKYT